MTIKEFQLQRKDTLTAEYHELKKNNTQQKCFDILAENHNLSAWTVRQIIFNSNYNTKKSNKAA